MRAMDEGHERQAGELVELTFETKKGPTADAMGPSTNLGRSGF